MTSNSARHRTLDYELWRTAGLSRFVRSYVDASYLAWGDCEGASLVGETLDCHGEVKPDVQQLH